MIRHSRFYSNTAAARGGAIFFTSEQGTLNLVNNIIADNAVLTPTTGGDVAADSTTPMFLHGAHNTFVAATPGVGIGLSFGSEDLTSMVTATNNLFSGYGMAMDARNTLTATLDGALLDNVTTPTSGTVTASRVVTGSAGFVDAAARNYLAIGDGVDVGADSGVAEDIRGVARPQGGVYDLGAYEAASARLAALSLTPGALSPAFVSSTTSYAAQVPNGTTSTAVTAAAADVSATVVYSSSAGACATGTCAIAGPKTWITVTVTAADGRMLQAYSIKITAVDANASTDASLMDLAIDPGTLTPAFVSSTTSYAANVPNGTTGVAVTATVNDANATVVVASSTGACTPGDASPSNCTVAGPKTWITVTVTAADGRTTEEYVIEITVANLTGGVSGLTIDPGTLAPAFVSSTTSYAASVPDGTFAVTATAEIYGAADVTYESSAGLCDGPVCPVAGPKTWITVTVMVDGATAATYFIEVTVAAPLTTIDRVWPGTGLEAGGMPVQIFGSGFAAALTVTVGPYDGVMIAVPFTIENDARIRFVMPEGVAGQRVSVTVATADSAQTAADAFTYVQPEVIEFEGNTGGVFTTTDGAVVTIPSQGITGTFFLTMTPLPPAPGVPGNILMYSFRLDAVLNGLKLETLTNPVTIQLPIDEGIFAIQDGERPWLYQWVGGEERGERGEERGERSEEREEERSALTSRSSPLFPLSSASGRWILVRGQVYEPTTRVMTVALRPMGEYALSTSLLRSYWLPLVPVLR
jgi:hypothetical protein